MGLPSAQRGGQVLPFAGTVGPDKRPAEHQRFFVTFAPKILIFPLSFF